MDITALVGGLTRKSSTVGLLKAGQAGWTVPWALRLTPKGYYIRSATPLQAQKTSDDHQLLVIRLNDGLHVIDYRVSAPAGRMRGSPRPDSEPIVSYTHKPLQ